MDKLLYSAFIVSMVGLLILTFAYQSIEPPLSRVSDIDQNSLGKNIRVQGNISRIHEFKGGSILVVLNDNGSEIDLYLPYYVSKSILDDISRAERIDVIGTVEIYKGKVEIVVDDKDSIRIVEG